MPSMAGVTIPPSSSAWCFSGKHPVPGRRLRARWWAAGAGHDVSGFDRRPRSGVPDEHIRYRLGAGAPSYATTRARQGHRQVDAQRDQCGQAVLSQRAAREIPERRRSEGGSRGNVIAYEALSPNRHGQQIFAESEIGLGSGTRERTAQFSLYGVLACGHLRGESWAGLPTRGSCSSIAWPPTSSAIGPMPPYLYFNPYPEWSRGPDRRWRQAAGSLRPGSRTRS